MWIILLHITNLKGSSKQIKVPTHQHYSKIQSNETLHWDDVRQGWLAFGLGELGCCQGRHLLEGAVVYWCRSSLNRNTLSMVTWQTHLSGIPSNCLGFLLIMTAVIVIRRHECMISPFEITEMEILPRNRFQGLFLPHNQPRVFISNNLQRKMQPVYHIASAYHEGRNPCGYDARVAEILGAVLS